ncbi:MAG: TldD/PmbA family protein [Chloroflexota bacterium]|nr:TldD/PmbA family protein [Chloroflexota bacterium]
MINEEDLKLAEDIVKLAQQKGADEAEVRITSSRTFSTTVRKGEVEKISENEPHSLTLRVYKEKRGATVFSSDFRPAALERLVEDAVERTTYVDPDPESGLPDPEDLAKDFDENLDLWDPMVGDLPPEIKINLARQTEETALTYDSRITNTNGASFGSHIYSFVLANSLGFAGGYRGSSCSMYMSAVADDSEGKKQTDGWYSSQHHFNRLEKPEEIGQKAAERTLRRLGARKVKTQTVPVIWDQETASEFLGILAGAIMGGALYRGMTFLADKEGQQIAAPGVTIVDDPLRPGLPGSRPFDGEGVYSRRNEVFSKGVFNQFLFNTYYARKMKRRTTGNSGGITNFYLEPGSLTPEEIIAGVDEGLYLTDMIGFGENITTGDFSRGASGIWIEKGKLTYPVSEINISGDLRKMLAGISQIGNDLEFRHSVAAPTFRMDGMMISGL